MAPTHAKVCSVVHINDYGRLPLPGEVSKQHARSSKRGGVRINRPTTRAYTSRVRTHRKNTWVS
eukprot:scaffold23635_cov58-Skeletonema_marinoi.AAC.1